MDIRIRPMRLEDLEEVMQIEPAAFGRNHWSRQSFINELNNACGFYFVARQSTTQKLVGYTGFQLVGTEAHITTLAVHPENRYQRTGEWLLVHSIEAAGDAGSNWMTLEVRKSNDKALKLYSKYGFKSLGLRPRYYQDNDEDALVLWTDNIHLPEFKTMLSKRVKALRNPDELCLFSGTQGNPGAQ